MVKEFQFLNDSFQIEGSLVHIERFGCGHINRTYYAKTDAGKEYLFQLVNTKTFPDIDGLMGNINAVTSHIRGKVLAEGGNPDREGMTVIPTKDNKAYLRTENGDCWRCYIFISDTETLQAPRNPHDFYLSARAFGKFQKQLKDFPAATLCDVIPNFHNTPKRLRDLFQAESADVMGRAKEVQEELEFVRARTEFAATLQSAIESGELPLAVTHNDTKLNNLLFDATTMEPISIVDLDTVMPGSALYDFGDSIRFGAASAAEDEKDLDKVFCQMELFEAYVKGWAESCGESMSEAEKKLLHICPRIMTLECGSRFLEDYLRGDTYFATHYPGQNLDRCRTQLKLVADMEAKEETMRKIVEKYL